MKKEYPPCMSLKSCKFLQMIFGWEQREEDNNITRDSSRSGIFTLLTLLGPDAKSALLRVPSWI